MKFLKIIICYSLYASIIYPLDIKDLKDTHTILPDSNYAPFQGLIFLEEEIAEQWYTLCPDYQAKNIQHTLEQVHRLYGPTSEKIDNLANEMIKILTEEIKNSATENFIMHMFHIAGETFNIVSALNNPIRQLTPKHIGEICRILADSSDSSKLTNDPIYKTTLINHIKTRQKLSKDDQNLSTSELKTKYQKFITKKSAPTQEDPIILQNYLQSKLLNYLSSLKFKKASGSDFVSKDFNPFVTDLMGSLQECAPTNPSKIYPENSTQGLLLSYMLAKANDRNDLQEYFRGFLGDDTFTLPIAHYTSTELETLSEIQPDLQKINSIANYICALVFTAKYAAALPRIVANKTIPYQGNNFPDCVETMMRNLVNIISYDAKNQKLGVAPTGLSLGSQLTVFYSNKMNANPTQVKNTDVHKAWLKLVENKEGCSYNRLVVRGTQNVLEVRDLCDGVIPLETFNNKLPKKQITIAGKNYTVFEQKVGTKTYWLVPTSGELDCFELMPTLSNMIILLNTFFNLKLLNPAQQAFNNLMSRDFGNEALEKKFVHTYFKKMCKKLQWDIPQEIFEKIKTFAFTTNHSLEIPVTLPNNETFTISIYDKAHGSIIVDQDSQAKDHITPQEFFTLDNAVQAALLASKAVNYHKIFNITAEHDHKPCNELYKCIDVLNKENKLTFMSNLLFYRFGGIFQGRHDGKMYEDNDYLALLLASFSTELDTHYQNELIEKFAHDQDYSPLILKILNILADVFYETNQMVTGKALCFALQNNTDQMWHWIELGMQDKDSYLRQITLSFLPSILQWNPPFAIASNKIDLILSWIEKDIQDPELTEDCIYAFLRLILKIQPHSLNATQNQIATKLLKTYRDYITANPESWLQMYNTPEFWDTFENQIAPATVGTQSIPSTAL